MLIRCVKSSSIGGSNGGVRKRVVNAIQPRNPTQEVFLRKLRSKQQDPPYIIVGHGKAGSGKTACTVGVAVEKLLEKEVRRIVLTRPPVCVESQDMGFLPGALEKKMHPWLLPIFDCMLDYITQNEIDTMIKERVIDIAPLAFMRGRSFNDSFVICDEAQNMTPNQMLMLLTRLGQNSKMVVLGDPEQHDQGQGSQDNGLTDLIHRMENYESTLNCEIEQVYFDESSIERHFLIPAILDMYKF